MDANKWSWGMTKRCRSRTRHPIGNVMALTSWECDGEMQSLANTQLSACKTNDENDFESNLNTMQEKGEAGPKLISIRNMRKAVTICVAGLKCWFFAQIFWLGHCHIRKYSSHPRTPRCSGESSWFHWVRTNRYNRLQHMNCHSSIAQQGALIAEQMSSSQRDPSPLHILIFACFSQAHSGLGVKWIEMVWDLAQSRDLEPSEREVAREMQSLPSTQFTKAPCRHATFCLQKMCFSPSHTTLLLRIILISLSPDKQLQPAKTHELSQLNSATRRADRGANVFVTEGSVTLAYFDSCMFFTSPQNREPAVRPYKHLLRRWQFRCEMDWNGLRPCSESRFGTRRKRNCKGNAKPSKYTIYKASQTRNFLLAKHNEENDFDSNPNASQEEEWCWSTMSPRKAVTRIQDSKVGSLRVFAWSCWKHLTKCETIQTIRRHHYHPHAYAASLQVAHKRTKSNILRQLFLTPLKSL